uniref:Uncharacterized protein n=1 Tax=Oncorhynchus kisutch TaxID=8019 RepID=A0A8C7GI42_ONCKI
LLRILFCKLWLLSITVTYVNDADYRNDDTLRYTKHRHVNHIVSTVLLIQSLSNSKASKSCPDGCGWTLVASVHENNIYGKCTLGDRWTSQQPLSARRGWQLGATADDYKNPGYYDIKAQDMSVWHIPNNKPMKDWNPTAILRYHTETRFLSQYGGNLYELFHRYPVKYNAGAPLINNGPSIPIVYDHGDKQTTKAFYGPYPQREFEPGFISFRAINWEWAAMAICSGTKPKGGQVDAYCIGGGGHFPEAAPKPPQGVGTSPPLPGMKCPV